MDPIFPMLYKIVSIYERIVNVRGWIDHKKALVDTTLSFILETSVVVGKNEN